jgi:hypothetical protein
VVECYLGAALRKLDPGRESIDLLGVLLRQVGVGPVTLLMAKADSLAPCIQRGSTMSIRNLVAPF